SAQEPMTHYDLAASPFRFYRSAQAWAATPRLAAINCFADGGTNAHLILQGWDATPSFAARRQPIAPPVLQPWDVRAPAHHASPSSKRSGHQGAAARVTADADALSRCAETAETWHWRW